MKKIVIAIDGFSSCGKSTMAKDLAKRLGYIYVDTGAMYRAVTLYCVENNLFKDDVLDIETLKEQIKNVQVGFRLNSETGLPDTYLNGRKVEEEIRTMAVSQKVSIVSAVDFVRYEMVRLQQEMGKSKGVVMDGRDVGTVIFPDAELKIFVTASVEIRAQRRLDELRGKGDTETTFEEVAENIQKRDFADQTRAVGPLRQAEDAILLDNSHLTREEQMDWLLDRYKQVVNE